MSIWSIFFSYKGRISRRTYWCAIGMRVLVFFSCVLVLPHSSDLISFIVTVPLVLLLLLTFYVVFPIIVKRWHDMDKSGWWLFIEFIPVFGMGWRIFECGFFKGTEGSNRFGPDPSLNDLNPDLIKYVTVSPDTTNTRWIATAHLVDSVENRGPRIIYGGEDESEARRQAALFVERFQCEIIQ
ncbi:hypothetical protein C6502_22330 [Candidatus Poribacteria bacterium]|nr:MAG: hypothetical protein C6502_22330 [Candidatus Poribacteria bacterium]